MIQGCLRIGLSLVLVGAIGFADENKISVLDFPLYDQAPVDVILKLSTLEAVRLTRRQDLADEIVANKLQLKSRLFRVFRHSNENKKKETKQWVGYKVYVTIPDDTQSEVKGGIVTFCFDAKGNLFSRAKAVEIDSESNPFIPSALSQVEGPVPGYFEFVPGQLKLFVSENVPLDSVYKTLRSLLTSRDSIRLSVEAWSPKDRVLTWRFPADKFVELDWFVRLARTQINVKSSLYERKLSKETGKNLVSIGKKKIRFLNTPDLNTRTLNHRPGENERLEYVEVKPLAGRESRGESSDDRASFDILKAIGLP